MELATHERKILDTMRRIGEREAVRASDAGEDREEIGSLLELTGLNKKAFSFVRSLHRMEEEKRSDVLRSLTPLLSLMRPHWDGGQKDWVDEASRPAGETEPNPGGEPPSDEVIEAFASRGHEEPMEGVEAPADGTWSDPIEGDGTGEPLQEIRSEADSFDAAAVDTFDEAPEEELRRQNARQKIEEGRAAAAKTQAGRKAADQAA